MRDHTRLLLLGFALSVLIGLSGCGKAASLTSPIDSGAAVAPAEQSHHAPNPPLGTPVDPSAQ